jgi:hypothetical protein
MQVRSPHWDDGLMITIRNTLTQFLAETGEGNRRSMASPFAVIELFADYLDGYGHEGLNEFERARFDKEWSDDNRFCDIFGPDHVQPYHLNSFLSTFVIRKVMSTKGFLKACGPVVERLAAWLREQGHWDEQATRYYRELVGDKAGGDLVGCEELAQALHDHVQCHPVPEAEADADDDYFNDQFTIKKVEPGRLVFEGLLEGDRTSPSHCPNRSLPKPRLAGP